MATLTTMPAPTAPAITKRRFSVKEYYLMAEAGILSPRDRVELIDGEIVQMAAMGSYHAGCVLYLSTAFSQMLGQRAFVNVQSPVRLSERSEPEPDIALLRPRADFYTESHPRPEDVMLIVEVSHSTVEYDRDVKTPLYAEAGIPELWLVNLDEDYIDGLSDPVGSGYRTVRRYVHGDRIAPALLPDAALEVSEILRRGSLIRDE